MVVGIVLRLLDLLLITAIEIDGIEYAGTAMLFAKGAFGAALRGMRVPLYPAFTGLLSLVTNDPELAGRLVSLICGVLLIPLCYFFVKRFFTRETALFAAATVAVCPYLVRYSGAVLSESLATFLLTAATFSFYRGWMDDKPAITGISGMLLTLAYLTRSEYIIYFLPLAAILLFHQRRWLHIGAFLGCFFAIAFTFLLYVRIDTGFWVIDRRMLQVQAGGMGTSSRFSHIFMNVPLRSVLMNIPTVMGNFCDAVFIPFFLFALLGARRARKSYLVLVATLVAFHVVGRSFTPYSTPRYSVEFAPMVAVLAAKGMEWLTVFPAKWKPKRTLSILLLGVIGALAIFMSIETGNSARALDKKAGQFLRGKNAGPVAARLPISSFYAHSGWVYLGALTTQPKTCSELAERLLASKVAYIVVDDRTEEEVPLLKQCVGSKKSMAEFRDHDDYVKVFVVKQLTTAAP